MGLAVVSDIHGNLEAWQAVLADIRAHGIQSIICLGDTIGYGADPKACLELVRKHVRLVISGNHECALGDALFRREMNAEAAVAMDWTERQLGSVEKKFVARLSLDAKQGEFYFVHASPANPSAFTYLTDMASITSAFSAFSEKICLIGHTHRAAAAELTWEGKLRIHSPGQVLLRPGGRYIINVGSVGQPRDGDNRARWLEMEPDKGRVNFHAVVYPVATAQAKIRCAGLPAVLADRLANGY